MSHPLDGSCERLKTAKAQADEIEDLLSCFRDKSAYELVQEDNTGQPIQVFRVRLLKPPDARLSVVIGQFAHNVRTALNRVVWELTALSDATFDERDVEFPIFRTFNGDAIWKRLRGIPDAFSDAREIIRGLQPYQCDNSAHDDLLWVVHRLNGLDKYSIDHSIGYAVTYYLGQPGAGARLSVTVRRLEDDSPIVVPHIPGMERHFKVGFTVGIQIPDSPREGPGTFFNHGNFQLIHQYVAGIVLSFERFFL